MHLGAYLKGSAVLISNLKGIWPRPSLTWADRFSVQGVIACSINACAKKWSSHGPDFIHQIFLPMPCSDPFHQTFLQPNFLLYCTVTFSMLGMYIHLYNKISIDRYNLSFSNLQNLRNTPLTFYS